MNRVDWRRLNRAFEVGVGLPMLDRAEYLLALADQDPALADEVARMLATASDPDNSLLKPVIAATADLWVCRRAEARSIAATGDDRGNDEA